jgi:membrane protease YdiL (CAAX protease family)
VSRPLKIALNSILFVSAVAWAWLLMNAGWQVGIFTLSNWYILEALFLLAFQYTLVGCGEEVLFRLGLMDWLFIRTLKWKPSSAILVSSAIFGALHLFNGVGFEALPQACGATLCGVLFAYVYRKYGLFWAIALHATYDFCVVLSAILR